MPAETTMPPNTVSRSDTFHGVMKLARFGIIATLIFGMILMFADLSPVRSTYGHVYLSERVLIFLFFVIAAEVIGAIAAGACLALWKK
jgi:hypothetical protein